MTRHVIEATGDAGAYRFEIANHSAIHVVGEGTGPTVLCLHGIGSSSSVFRPQIDALSDRLRILA